MVGLLWLWVVRVSRGLWVMGLRLWVVGLRLWVDRLGLWVLRFLGVMRLWVSLWVSRIRLWLRWVVRQHRLRFRIGSIMRLWVGRVGRLGRVVRWLRVRRLWKRFWDWFSHRFNRGSWWL